ncbi:Asp-tRNA(Asn)/Glu-tRNA(Gln) amidotransferase subunit GatB [Spiroplasma endosymbiont of Labia minor]|uniref:Asp-tRNA(Asn)/Glu-tRNA(Gln) amidotransferase subunit GatB n=1 Tax=Spiroplasma endosymbiont of Labia minor TaxID=3066305 RepID=UPI0030CCF5F5
MIFKNFEIVIGIENHVELKTKSKMFGYGPVVYGAEPNTKVSEVDMGYPGALPSVNKKGVKLAILAANALNMEIDALLRFDRKNYYYPDLVKGYQITQQFHPIGRNGELTITLSDNTKKNITIERMHIEEDTAKQIHKNDTTFIDYNRSGVGLIEIVTNPIISSAEEAIAYVEKLREILLYLGVSDVKMNEGSLRCDVNISVRPFGCNKLGTKVEIKNLNSLSNVKKAIDFEVERQTKLYMAGKNVDMETRRFDETLQETVSMRKKSNSVDYKYFREPNIMPIRLDDNWIEYIISNSPETADIKRYRYQKEYGLKFDETNSILQNMSIMSFFEQTISLTTNYTKVANLIITDIQAYLNKNNFETISDTYLLPENLAELINLVDDGLISSKHIKTILPIILESDSVTPKKIIENLKIKLISDPNEIKKMIMIVINENLDLLTQYDNRPERVLKTIMGILMKNTQGNINPDITQKILVEQINEILEKQK